MNKNNTNIANSSIVEIAIKVALLLLQMIGLDPSKNPKAQKYLAQNIKPRLARNVRKDRVDKIRIGITTGYQKYRPTGEISELSLGIAVADFVCAEYDLPLKDHPSLLREYNNLVLFYESLFGKCCEPESVGALLSGRVRRKKTKTTAKATEEATASTLLNMPEAPTPEVDKSYNAEQESETRTTHASPENDADSLFAYGEDGVPD